jgi:UDP-2,4-diacetamido-2,4,6-trideoxy-beta-L-altropyranose hydrolase
MARIAFRVNANQAIGSGNLHRCLSLASGLREVDPSSEIYFFTSSSSDYADKITGAGFVNEDIGAIGWVDQDLEQTLEALEKNKIDMLIIDSHATDEKYLKALKAKTFLVVIDDSMHLKRYSAHVLVNPNVYSHLLQYSCDEETELLLGTEFVQLRKEFEEYQDIRHDNPEYVKRILVTFGGSDQKGAAITTVRALKSLSDSFTATVVVGRCFKKGEELAREIGLDDRFMVLRDVPDMSKKMEMADLAIASPGATFYELLFFRLPSILITQTGNQAMLADYAGKMGLAMPLGNMSQGDSGKLAAAIKQLMLDKQQRDRMSARMADIVDGMGRFRLATELLKLHREQSDV